jgi:hypothetical protein
MGRLLVEIIVIILVSSIAFVLGAIVGSGKRKRDEAESLFMEEENQSGPLVFKNRFNTLS